MNDVCGVIKLSTITQNNSHPLQQLLSPKIEKHYSTRARP